MQCTHNCYISLSFLVFQKKFNSKLNINSNFNLFDFITHHFVPREDEVNVLTIIERFVLSKELSVNKILCIPFKFL